MQLDIKHSVSLSFFVPINTTTSCSASSNSSLLNEIIFIFDKCLDKYLLKDSVNLLHMQLALFQLV